MFVTLGSKYNKHELELYRAFRSGCAWTESQTQTLKGLKREHQTIDLPLYLVTSKQEMFASLLQNKTTLQYFLQLWG